MLEMTSIAYLAKSLLSLICLTLVGSSNSQERSFEIINESGANFDLFWLNPKNGEGVKLSPASIIDGERFPLNSFVGHEFELREVPLTEGGNCSSPDKVCHKGNFVVSENENASKLD